MQAMLLAVTEATLSEDDAAELAESLETAFEDLPRAAGTGMSSSVEYSAGFDLSQPHDEGDDEDLS